MAPSVLEDMYKSQIVKARSPRKFGTTPRTSHFGHVAIHNQGLLGNSSGSSIINQLGAHSSHHHVGHFAISHPNNFTPDEMMEVSTTGMPMPPV